jgi:uncharacterized FlaG/YvyC family protein
MIEAVKSTLSASPVLQKNLEQASNARSFAANPDKNQEVSSDIPYVSPSVRVDNNSKMAILEFRDSATGDVMIQIPSEAQIEAYKRRRAVKEATLEAELNGTNKKIEQAEAQNDEVELANLKSQAKPKEESVSVSTEA